MMCLMNTGILNLTENFETIEYRGINIALNICEDLWNISGRPIVCDLSNG